MPGADMPAKATYARYRAPADNNAALVDPDWRVLLARLREPATRADLTIGGVPLARLASEARRDLLAAAHGDAAGPLILSGHQPELFHPGVWFKNFALASLAGASGGVGVHLVIDTDLCRATSIRVPTGSIAAPRWEAVPYDRPGAPMAYEERRVLDRSVFDSFATRVASTIEPFVGRPLVTSVWPHARAAIDAGGLLADGLSAARHAAEPSFDCPTLELPFSTVCDSAGFRRLLAEILLHADKVADAYNGALAEYRAAHGLKNAAQPLPDLATDDAWREAPLWVWSIDHPARRPLFVRRDGERVELSDHAGWVTAGPADADGVVAWLGELRGQGIKIRSRALVTTLYCRLVLADLFLHGIGGAKYDQVTDRFAERWLGVRPPAHATLSATLRLPIEHDSPTEADRRAALRRLRDLRYHPEKFAPNSDAAAVKQRWVATAKTPANAAERHEAITQANEAMAASLTDERVASEERLKQIEHGLRAAAVLDSREHSFCLFPADDIKERLQRLTAIE
ncbi:hypothetical protein Pla108_14710 [Botrimarina colliarenosi]|uniref:Uncharacterized protein n=1 Tax=Botrimarina colliarenosi TaxID=2528001 RepID=A0A5C6AMM8_9BACT|nr:hypothetical protein [Botrimarina colliarenosi]TWU00519.1 hypothetical protein Pla108_14710 [Botrimarina colliarenosi]